MESVRLNNTDKTGPELEALLGGEGVTAVLSLTTGETP